MFTLRPFDIDTDKQALIDTVNQDRRSPLTETMVYTEMQRRLDQREPFHQRTAVTTEGVPVGFSDVAPVPWASQGTFGLVIHVDRQWRRRGIGTALLEDARAWAEGQTLKRLTASVRDDDPDSRAFLEKRNFVIKRQRFTSELDVASFDETPFSGIVEAKEAEGLRLGSLAELGDNEENRRRLYEINCLAGLDEPASDGSVIEYDRFAKMVFGAWWYRADGQFLALDGDTAVGIAAVGHNREQNYMFHAFTGTHPAYRGRGIALALKLLTIRLAKQEGVPMIRTNNDSLNPAMLAINQKLGYVRQPGQYQLDLVQE